MGDEGVTEDVLRQYRPGSRQLRIRENGIKIKIAQDEGRCRYPCREGHQAKNKISGKKKKGRRKKHLAKK